MFAYLLIPAETLRECPESRDRESVCGLTIHTILLLKSESWQFMFKGTSRGYLLNTYTHAPPAFPRSAEMRFPRALSFWAVNVYKAQQPLWATCSSFSLLFCTRHSFSKILSEFSLLQLLLLPLFLSLHAREKNLLPTSSYPSNR